MIDIKCNCGNKEPTIKHMTDVDRYQVQCLLCQRVSDPKHSKGEAISDWKEKMGSHH